MYRLSAKASSDIEYIIRESISQFGKEQTNKYYISLKNCLQTLSTNPNIGLHIDWLRPNYLKFPHKSHIIFYKVEKNGVFIVRVLHKAMDAQSKI